MASNLQGFQYVLESLPKLKGIGDFVARMPFLFYNQVTNGGVVGYRKHILNYYPKDGADPKGNLFSGHIIQFSYEGKSIITSARPTESAPIQRPDREFIRERLESPGKFYPDYAGLDREIFKKGVVLGGAELRIVVDPISKQEEFKGRVGPYWANYFLSVGKPLINALWRT